MCMQECMVSVSPAADFFDREMSEQRCALLSLSLATVERGLSMQRKKTNQLKLENANSTTHIYYLFLTKMFILNVHN